MADSAQDKEPKVSSGPPNLAPKAVVGQQGWWRYSSEVQQPPPSGGDLVWP
ncbi:hypothetical protein [Streptomyces sp. NPDC020362]|uniref:hypothetical protein n=1 Tax=unclassified Streptomyces TaxID=2593676 RepID=UPI0033C3AFE9